VEWLRRLLAAEVFDETPEDEVEEPVVCESSPPPRVIHRHRVSTKCCTYGRCASCRRICQQRIVVGVRKFRCWRCELAVRRAARPVRVMPLRWRA